MQSPRPPHTRPPASPPASGDGRFAPPASGGARSAGPGPAGAPERRAVRLLGAAALLAALTGCGSDQAAEARGPGAGATGVTAAQVTRDTLSVDLRAVGSLEADARVRVQPEVDGRVTDIQFEEGQAVQKGQVLVRLDRNKLLARVEAARAAVSRALAEEENLARQVERNDSLLAQGAISQQAYDDLETQYNTARARLEEARANLKLARQELEDATIRAPFDGRVGARAFDLGDYVTVGTRLFTVVDDDPMEISFSVPERYLGQLHRGSSVTVRVRSFPDRTFEGRVDYVSPYVDPDNRTVELKARIPNPASELRSGQFANVVLQLEERPTLVMPEAAVLPRRDGNFVYAVEGGKAYRRQVELGQRQKGVVEVLAGMAAGDTVVVAGQQRLSDGAAVSVSMASADVLTGGGGARPDGAAPEVPDTAPAGG